MKENISALMDGELEGGAADETFDLLRRDGEAADRWRLYHLMSDAMRGQRPLVSAGFVERVGLRLRRPDKGQQRHAQQCRRAPRDHLGDSSGRSATVRTYGAMPCSDTRGEKPWWASR